MKKALILGVNGQDGRLLSELLLKKKYLIWGTHYKKTKNKNFKILNLNILKFEKLRNIIRKFKPHEIYNFAGISDLKSNEKDFLISEKINNLVVINILEEIKNTKIKYFQPITSEIYGHYSYEKKIKKNTIYNPQSSYAISKLSSMFYMKLYREKFGTHAVTGVLFNHESEFRKNKFVTKMIVENIHKIRLNKIKQFQIRNLDAKRDWGYARDYMQLIHKCTIRKKPADYLIGSGKLHSVKDIVEVSCKYFGIKVRWKKIGKVVYGIDQNDRKIIKSPYKKNINLKTIYADNSEISKIFKFKPSLSFKELIKLMCKFERNKNLN
tara:strand:+ start:3354 stop:4325 length:972 start_codon:yes stop_codon:yes gene_type:complete